MKKNKLHKQIHNLVIGSEGFVGGALCTFLEQKGEKVTRFDIKRKKEEDARTATLPLHKFDRVYFLAWEVGGAKYLYRDNTQFHQLNWNIDIMHNIMPQLHEHKTPFIFVSSQLAEETDTVYGATKKLGELLTKQIGGTCIRLWNVYGVLEENTEKSHVIGDFVYEAIHNGKIEMMTTGEERRQFIHIQDVCDGLYHVLSNNLKETVYDLTSFEWTSIKEVANIIGKKTNAKIVTGTQKGSARLIAILKGKPPGWSSKIDIENGIKIMVDEAKRFYGKKAKK